MITRRAMGLGLGFSFSAGLTAQAEKPLASVPVTLTDSRITISCTIGGRGPFQFALDTGGVISLINLQVARQLGLKQRGQMQLGMGGGQASYPIFEATDVLLGGGAREGSIAVAGTDIITFGDGVAGSFAAGLLTASASELDLDAGVLRLFRTNAPPRERWAKYSNAIEHQGMAGGSAYLYATLELDGQRLRCALDTGYPQPLRLTPASAARLGLASRSWSPAALRGRPKLRIVRAAALQLGGVRFDKPLVSYAPDGDRNSVYGEGIIGLPLLRQFNLATEPSTSSLWMIRNHQAPEPPPYNKAGLWLDRSGSGSTIGLVGKGSPAEAAGIQVGDTVEGDFSKLIHAMQGPTGAQLPLKITHGGQPRDLVLTLADYL